jgi:hypothetical protein
VGRLGKGVLDTDNVLAVLVPQLLVAVTEIVPVLVPTVTLIVFEVELPVQPLGKVQEYVSPATFVTL